MEFVQWFFGEFIPFGDLVSDVALVLTLPSSRDSADSSQSAALYQFMRWLLWVGTIVSSIPEIALFVGISSGLLIGTTLGPATCSTDGKGMDVLMSNSRATKSLLRYILSESKTITRFILHLTKDVPHEWGNAVSLVVRFVFFVPLYPITYPCLRLWESIKPKAVIRVGNGPTGDDLEAAGRGPIEAKDIGAKESPEPWYTPLVFVQVVAGLMTEISSIFFAVSTGNVLSIASAAFGLYCLSVSTLVAILQGPKSTPKSLPEEQSSPETVQELREEIFGGCCTDWSKDVAETIGIILLCILFIVIGFGLACLPFIGVYVHETGDEDTGRILMYVGAGVFFFVALCLFSSEVSAGFYFLAVSAGLTLIGLGVVFSLTAGFTAWVISLFVGGGVVLLCTACVSSGGC